VGEGVLARKVWIEHRSRSHSHIGDGLRPLDAVAADFSALFHSYTAANGRPSARAFAWS
jgi:hypothetical protein